MKTGNITGSGSDSALIGAVAPASPTSLTLGALAASIMANAAAVAFLLIDISDSEERTLSVLDGADQAAIATALDGADVNYEFTMADDTKSSSEWDTDAALTPAGATPDQSADPFFLGALDESIGYTRPSRSGASLVGALEDAFAAVQANDPDTGCLIAVNQTTKTVTVHRGSAAGAAGIKAAAIAASSASATFTQAVPASPTAATGFWAL